MKTSRYLPAIVSIGAIWILLTVDSSAQSSSLNLPVTHPVLAKSTNRQARIVAQNLEGTPGNTDVNKDFRLQNITIARNSQDKSLLTVTGSISNHSEQPHYLYYIVAKFISNDTSIKQTIIPVNIDLEPGQSKLFTHEISADSSNSIVLETVKPVVVKYEYR
jgi:hypothetical protein